MPKRALYDSPYHDPGIGTSSSIWGRGWDRPGFGTDHVEGGCMTSSRRKLGPVIREAPLGELKVYRVYEHQFDELAQGSPVSLLLNFSLFFLGIAATAAGTV